MAPRAGARASRLTQRTDLYALGTVLFEMLSGAPPFQAPTPAETLARIVSERPPALGGFRPRVCRGPRRPPCARARPGRVRERDFRNGMKELMGGSLVSKVPFLPQMLARPGWIVSYLLDGGLSKLPNVVVPGKGPMELVDVGAALARSAVTWDDLTWMRKHWPGPIVIKGLLTGDDARRAVDAGAAAVVVSNHGGRQLDGVSASLRALPEVVAAVNGQVEVLMDGGIRRGSDIVKAICLGAKAVLCGRAYAYGLAVAGEAGVTRAIEILRADVDRTLKLLGCTSVAQLDRSYVDVPANWGECLVVFLRAPSCP